MHFSVSSVGPFRTRKGAVSHARCRIVFLVAATGLVTFVTMDTLFLTLSTNVRMANRHHKAAAVTDAHQVPNLVEPYRVIDSK